MDDYVSELGSGPSIVKIRICDKPELDLFIFNFFKYSFPTVDRLSFLTVAPKTKIRLGGFLGKKYGKHHHFLLERGDAKAAAKALDANYPGFARDLADAERRWGGAIISASIVAQDKA